MRKLGAIAIIVMAFGVARAAPQKDDPLVDSNLRGPDPEFRPSQTKLNLPTVPAFDLPLPPADGTHAVKELRVKGKKLLDGDVTIRGVVTWVYDCVTAIRKPGMTDKAAQKLIDDDPTVCERPKFYIGDTANTSPDKSIWVVDVPRPYNKLEMKRLRPQDRTAPDRCEPAEKDPKKRVCPPYKAGDEIVITGAWRLASPHSERNSDGLLVYKWMENVTQRWETPGPRPAQQAVAPAAPQPIDPALPPITKTASGKQVRQSMRDDSMAAMNDGMKAYGAKQWDTAIERYRNAVDRWPDNHSAWYALSAAYAQRREWAKASEASAAAVAIVADVAMYRLMYGRTLYEKIIASAREDQARRENRRPEEVEVDVGALNFEKPLEQLRQAVRLDANLWRAHYLIGAIYRNAGRPARAAEEFTRALVAVPTEPAPWIALAELYRHWDYTDQAIQVAQQGALVISGVERSELWFEVGMGFDDKRADKQAIDAFTKALDARSDNHKAKFQRGQAYFHMGVYDKAMRDLEEFSKTSGASLEFFRQQASRMLMDIAAKKKQQ